MHRLDAHIPGLADAVFRQINGIPPKPERAAVGTPGPGAPADEFALVTPPMTRAALEARLTGMTPGSMFRVLD